MERRPEAIDMTALAARIRPLAHQASVGLGQASEDLRQTLDHAGDAIATRVADGCTAGQTAGRTPSVGARCCWPS